MKTHVLLSAVVAAIVLGAVADVVLAGAQNPPSALPSFEVASVKANKSGDGRVMLGMQPGGRFTATNVPVRLLIRNAYRIQDFQIVNAPGWIGSERFDIVAKAETDVPPEQLQLMQRSLLADRFKLAVHNETRELPIYELVFARSDQKLGPKMKPSTTDCAALRGRGRGGAPPPPPTFNEPMTCGMRMGPGLAQAGGSPIAQFITMLANNTNRIIQDKTGLTGNFDFDLTWTPERLGGAAADGPIPGGGGGGFPAIDPNGPSLFTAIQEQLGLKLESTRGQVEVLVIDHIEQPTVD